MIRTRLVFETGKHFGRREARLTSRLVFRQRRHPARTAKRIARALVGTILRTGRHH